MPMSHREGKACLWRAAAICLNLDAGVKQLLGQFGQDVSVVPSLRQYAVN